MQDEIFSTKISGTTLSVSPDKDRVIIGGKEGVSLWKLPSLQANTDSTQPQQQLSQSPQPSFQSPGFHGTIPSSTKPSSSSSSSGGGGYVRGTTIYSQAYNQQNQSFLQSRQSSANEILTKKMQPIMSLAWNHRIKNTIAGCTSNGLVYLWQIAEGRMESDKFEWKGTQHCLFKDIKQTRKMTVVTWDPKDGNILFIGDTLGDIKAWDMRKPSTFNFMTKRYRTNPILDIKISPFQPNIYASSYEDGYVKLWDRRNISTPVVQGFIHKKNRATCLEWHPTRSGILASGGNYKVKIWNTNYWTSDNSGTKVSIHLQSQAISVHWREGYDDMIATVEDDLPGARRSKINIWNIRRPRFPVSTISLPYNHVSCFDWINSDCVASCSGKSRKLSLCSIQNASSPYKLLPVVALGFDNSNDLIYTKESLDHNNPADSTKFPDPFTQEIIERGGEIKPVISEKENVKSSHSPVLVEPCDAKQRIMTMFKVADPHTESNTLTFFDGIAENALVFSDKPGQTKWDLCIHNAEVYESFGRIQQAQLWRLLRSAYEPKQDEEDYFENKTKRQIYNYYDDLHENSDSPGIDSDDNSVDATSFSAPHEDELPCLVRKETVSPMKLNMMMQPFDSLSSAEVNVFSWRKEQKTTYDPLDDWGLSSSFLKETIYDTLLMYSDAGDFQICALVVLVLGDDADFPVDKMSRWFYSYIQLLQRMKLPVKIAEAMKACRGNLSSPYIEYGKPFSEYYTEKVTEQDPQRMRHNICSICHTAVRGPSAWCQVCGHGGHLEHMSAWFKEHDMCPSGCGHVCIYTKKKNTKK